MESQTLLKVWVPEGPFLCLLSLLPFWMPPPLLSGPEKPTSSGFVKKSNFPSPLQAPGWPEVSPQATQEQDRAGGRVCQPSRPPPTPQLLWEPGLLEFARLVTEPSLSEDSASPAAAAGSPALSANCRGWGLPGPKAPLPLGGSLPCDCPDHRGLPVPPSRPARGGLAAPRGLRGPSVRP